MSKPLMKVISLFADLITELFGFGVGHGLLRAGIFATKGTRVTKFGVLFHVLSDFFKFAERIKGFVIFVLSVAEKNVNGHKGQIREANQFPCDFCASCGSTERVSVMVPQVSMASP